VFNAWLYILVAMQDVGMTTAVQPLQLEMFSQPPKNWRVFELAM
jgi:hypothetical protein